MKRIKAYPFLVWLVAIANAPIAIMIEKYCRGEADQLGFIPATYFTLILYGLFLGAIPFMIYYFSWKRIMRSDRSVTSIKFISIVTGVLAINAFFFALGRQTFYANYYSLAIYYSAAIILTGIIFRLKRETK